MKHEFYYTSKDGDIRIHAIEWIPDGEIKGVLQICHGMVEHIDRYHEFAEYMNAHGFYVVGHDHIGHGKSVQHPEELGHFHEACGNRQIIWAIHALRKRTAKKYPNLPYVMLGHSMGSFLLRQYLWMHGKGLSAAVIMATGSEPAAVLHFGQFVCEGIAAVKGWTFQSRFVDELACGHFNKFFAPVETEKDWVTSDKERRDRYIADPLCSFTFSVGAYYQMFEGMKTLTKKQNLEKMPKEVPIFFVSGTEDPLGGFGRGIMKVYRKFLDVGMQDVQLKLYQGDRHELLNETDREQVFRDICSWIKEKTI